MDEQIYLLVFTLFIMVNDTGPAITIPSTSSYDHEIQCSLQPALTQDGYICSQIQWFCFNSTTRAYNCDQTYKGLIVCSDRGPSLKYGYCATYSEYTGLLSLTDCPYFQFNVFNTTSSGYTQLPSILTELNHSLCGPINRRGIVCSECAHGFGPSISSFGYKCINCTNSWYGVSLYLFLEFVPITVLYLFILILQIRVTSAPMTCFIMYAQFTVTVLDLASYESSLRKLMFDEKGDLRLDVKIVHTFYGVLNLDFFRYTVPPFCISNKIKFIHIVFLGYISVFYPIALIILTWVCVELHGCNFRPLVLLWKPYHRCFVNLRRRWNKKSDIIDVFVTFIFLSYNKCLYQTLVLLDWSDIINFNASGNSFLTYQPYTDRSIAYGSTDHVLIMIPAIGISLIFNVLPLLLLILYPIKLFRSCLSRWHVNFTAIDIFTEKVHGSYRNGLNGGYDMRIFASLYFVLRPMVILTWTLAQRFLNDNNWFCVGIVFLVITIIIALIKPYNRAYMNYMDTLLLSNLVIICCVLSQSVLGPAMLLFARITVTAPIVAFFLIILAKKCISYNILQKFYNCFQLQGPFTAITNSFKVTINVISAQEHQPLVHPTHSVVSINSGDRRYSSRL